MIVIDGKVRDEHEVIINGLKTKGFISSYVSKKIEDEDYTEITLLVKDGTIASINLINEFSEVKK